MRISKRLLLSSLPLSLAMNIVLVLASAAKPQERHEEPKYEVIITRPLDVRGWRATELYRTDMKLTETWNDLVRTGLDPIHFEIFTAGTKGDLVESRAMIVCRERPQ